jgi:hypothetical protein
MLFQAEWHFAALGVDPRQMPRENAGDLVIFIFDLTAIFALKAYNQVHQFCNPRVEGRLKLLNGDELNYE